MTFDYNKLSKKPGLFRNFTGFSQNEFDDIYRVIEERNDEFEKERLDRRDRKRSIGGGRKFKLVLRERFLMPANTKCLWPQNQRFCGLLVYYRLYITYALVGFLFDVDQSTVWRDIRHLEPLVKECIPIPKKMEDKMKKYGIMGSKFRNRYERYDTMTSIVGGFVNFRIMNSCTPILKV